MNLSIKKLGIKVIKWKRKRKKEEEEEKEFPVLQIQLALVWTKLQDIWISHLQSSENSHLAIRLLCQSLIIFLLFSLSLYSLSHSFFFLSSIFSVLDSFSIFHLFLLWGSLLMVWLGRKTVEKRRRERKRETQKKRRKKKKNC
jgi:hypothetical protein